MVVVVVVVVVVVLVVVVVIVVVGGGGSGSGTGTGTWTLDVYYATQNPGFDLCCINFQYIESLDRDFRYILYIIGTIVRRLVRASPEPSHSKPH